MITGEHRGGGKRDVVDSGWIWNEGGTEKEGGNEECM